MPFTWVDGMVLHLELLLLTFALIFQVEVRVFLFCIYYSNYRNLTGSMLYGTTLIMWGVLVAENVAAVYHKLRIFPFSCFRAKILHFSHMERLSDRAFVKVQITMRIQLKYSMSMRQNVKQFNLSFFFIFRHLIS